MVATLWDIWVVKKLEEMWATICKGPNPMRANFSLTTMWLGYGLLSNTLPLPCQKLVSFICEWFQFLSNTLGKYFDNMKIPPNEEMVDI